VPETVVWIQSALSSLGRPVPVTGSLDAATEWALRAVVRPDALGDAAGLKADLRKQLRHRKARGRVFVLRASLEQERVLRRGHGLVGLNAIERYEQAGGIAEHALHEYTDLDPLEKHLLQARPSLIHIVTGFLRAPSTREIHLDLAQSSVRTFDQFPSASYGEGAARLTASYLKSLLEQLPRDQPPPFLIVEATLPHDEFERARQVLLRNAFCNELLRMTRVRGILATGLFPSDTLLGSYDKFIAFLSLNPSAAHLHRFVWRNVPTAFPPALFTADPDLPAVC